MKAKFIGECMVELSTLDNGLLQKSFAGDVFNSAVYLKRLVGYKCDVSLLTAIGEDSISHEMEVFFNHQGLSTDTVFKTNDGTVGLYLITTDDNGERSFSYWRDNSVARQMMDILAAKKIEISELNSDLIFFTGISLGILTDASREILINQLSTARKKGAKIAFDPNYRPQLWETKEVAAKWIDKAYQVSDIIFPSFDEQQLLFGTASIEKCLNYHPSEDEKEVVLKAGADGMFVKYQHDIIHREFISADNVVDTTAAGDSFDGSYLAMRILGHNVSDSLEKAAGVAAKVVTYPGAIIPEGLTREP